MFNAPTTDDSKTTQATNTGTSAAPKLSAVPKLSPLAAEADALETAFGLRSTTVEFRGAVFKVRELEVLDLAPLYRWLADNQGEAAKLSGADEAAQLAFLQSALARGVDLLSIVTDGQIPKGARVNAAVATLILQAAIEVNEDFFTEMPTMHRMLMDMGLLSRPLQNTTSAKTPESTDKLSGESIQSDVGQKSSDNLSEPDTA